MFFRLSAGCSENTLIGKLDTENVKKNIAAAHIKVCFNINKLTYVAPVCFLEWIGKSLSLYSYEMPEKC